MKKLVIVCALLISAVTFAKAQGQMPAPGERAQRTIDGPALAGLNLTADQKTKTLALLTKVNTSSDSLRTAMGQGADREQMMTKRTAITAPAEKTFMSWLTADQKAAYDKALATMKEQNPNATGLLSGFGGRPRN